MCGSLLTALLVSISLSAIDNSLCVGNLMNISIIFFIAEYVSRYFERGWIRLYAELGLSQDFVWCSISFCCHVNDVFLTLFR